MGACISTKRIDDVPMVQNTSISQETLRQWILDNPTIVGQFGDIQVKMNYPIARAKKKLQGVPMSWNDTSEDVRRRQGYSLLFEFDVVVISNGNIVAAITLFDIHRIDGCTRTLLTTLKEAYNIKIYEINTSFINGRAPDDLDDWNLFNTNNWMVGK